MKRYRGNMLRVYAQRHLARRSTPLLFLAAFVIFFYISAPRTTHNMAIEDVPTPLSSRTLHARLRTAQIGVQDCSSFERTVAAVADLDRKSKVEGTAGRLMFHSYFKIGTLSRTCNNGNVASYSLRWDEKQAMFSHQNEAGRGFELSELVKFNDKLYTFDDRTGIVYEVLRGGDGKYGAVPRHILSEGNGSSSDKGMKIEWATVKDGELYVGSTGKDFTDDDGYVVHRKNLWITRIDVWGNVQTEDWSERYDRLKEAVGVPFPGYIVHEAIEWSSIRQQWVILPRRVSSEAYNEVYDESRGSDVLILANEDFTEFQVKHIGKLTNTRGFSTFKFVPDTSDSVIVALKSEENEALGTQATYATILDIDSGVEYVPETLMDSLKYEGIAFI